MCRVAWLEKWLCWEGARRGNARAAAGEASAEILWLRRPAQVAANRYNLFGRTDSCRLSDPRFEERFISS